jgi:alanine dehydrogenase
MTSPSIPFIDANAIRSAVPITDLLDAVEAAYRDVAAGRDRSPLRSHVSLDGGDLLLMPGVRAGGSGASVKLVTVMAGNAARGLPTVQAIVVWFDAQTGRPLALLDGAMVTAMRTGAASGVATRLLARADAETLAIFGAGGQAEWQVRAVLAARPIRHVAVYARSPDARSAFAERMEATTGVETRAVGSAREAVASADVVCCATTASEPVFEAAWLRQGTHVNGIGAFRLGMVELPPELFARAALVAVDARSAAMAEAGDLVAAVERGLVAEADLVEIGSVDRDWAVNRGPEAITAFKSVGLAIQDVAAAELIVARVMGEEGV